MANVVPPTPTDPFTDAYLAASKYPSALKLKISLEKQLATAQILYEEQKIRWSQYPGLIQDWNSGANTPFKYTFVSDTIKTAYNDYAIRVGGGLPTSIYIIKYDPKYLFWGAGNPGLLGAYNRATGDKVNVELPTDMATFWVNFNKVKKLTEQLVYVKNRIIDYQQAVRTNPDFTTITPKGTLSLAPIIGLEYNVGSVKEAYHTTRQQFLDEMTVFGQHNSPSTITNASQLWENSKLNKGMIQTNTYNLDQNKSVPNWSGAPAPTGAQVVKLKNPYAYQFQYNPATITMTYAGIVGVDPNYERAGDAFNFVGAVASGGTIGFSILLNRMFDRKYYDKTTRKLADQYKNIPDLYFPRMPDENEQLDIYNKGTMYDIEYILRSVIGYARPTYLNRNMADGFTADVGYIGGAPVEVHLGPTLRYLVTISQLQVQHILFDERMVPIYTQVDVSCVRYIDGPADPPSTTDQMHNSHVDVPPAKNTPPGKTIIPPVTHPEGSVR